MRWAHVFLFAQTDVKTAAVLEYIAPVLHRLLTFIFESFCRLTEASAELQIARTHVRGFHSIHQPHAVQLLIQLPGHSVCLRCHALTIKMVRSAVSVENRPLTAGALEADHLRFEQAAGSRRYLAVSFRLPITPASVSVFLLVCCTVLLLGATALRHAPPWGGGSPPYEDRFEALRPSSRPLRVWRRANIAVPEGSTDGQPFDASATSDQGVRPAGGAQAIDDAAASVASGTRQQPPSQIRTSEDAGSQPQAGRQQPVAAPSSDAAAAAAPLGNQEATFEHKRNRRSRRPNRTPGSKPSGERGGDGSSKGGGNRGGKKRQEGAANPDKAKGGSSGSDKGGSGGGSSSGGGFTEVSTGPIQQHLLEAVRQAATPDGGVIMSVGNRDGMLQVIDSSCS